MIAMPFFGSSDKSIVGSVHNSDLGAWKFVHGADGQWR
jgi:hypothetical protein